MTTLDVLRRADWHPPFAGSFAALRRPPLRRSRIERARRKRDGDGDGFYDPDGKGPLPDKTPVAPRYLDPDSFSGDIAIRLHSGEPAHEVADDLAFQARNLRDSARTEDNEERRAALLRVARQRAATAKRLRAVADLPRKPKPKTPNPRPVPARPAAPKPNPRTVPPAPLPSRPMTPAEQKLADDFAAGRINKAQLRAILTGKTPEKFQPEETLAFVRGMVTAGYITELARTGDRDRLEAYLRRQNTTVLLAAAPFFGLHIPDNAGHDRIVALFHAQALKLEGPPPPPTRTSLMSRKVVDLKASLRAAGLPVSGTKPMLVDRLLAAIQAATGGQS